MRQISYRSFDRHREKQISRERDDHALRSGVVSIEILSRQNNFFASLDLSRARIGWPRRSRQVQTVLAAGE
jgi:hypothetical protein